MAAFILRRFGSMLFVLFCVVSLTFCMVPLMKGGPFDKEKKLPDAIEKQLLARFNLDGSLWQKYTIYIGARKNVSDQYSGLLQGDLQHSTKYRNLTVKEVLAQTLPATMIIGLAAFILATTLGVWLGSWAAVRHNTAIDTGAML